jgi:hypothetical protein
MVMVSAVGHTATAKRRTFVPRSIELPGASVVCFGARIDPGNLPDTDRCWQYQNQQRHWLGPQPPLPNIADHMVPCRLTRKRLRRHRLLKLGDTKTVIEIWMAHQSVT